MSNDREKDLAPAEETDFISKNMDAARNHTFLNKMGYLQKLKMNAAQQHNASYTRQTNHIQNLNEVKTNNRKWQSFKEKRARVVSGYLRAKKLSMGLCNFVIHIKSWKMLKNIRELLSELKALRKEQYQVVFLMFMMRCKFSRLMKKHGGLENKLRNNLRNTLISTTQIIGFGYTDVCKQLIYSVISQDQANKTFMTKSL